MLNKSIVSMLQGEWDVHAFGIIGPMFNLAGDSKCILGTSGYNLINKRSWGFFRVEEDLEYKDGLVLNYDDPRNNYLLRKVRDRIRINDGNSWHGTFYLGVPVFKFELISILTT